MEIVDKIINLRTTQENMKKELEKYRYYKKINEEDEQIINRRNEYYKFLLRCIRFCNENISIYSLNTSVYTINSTYEFNIYYLLGKVIATAIVMIFNFITRKLFLE